MMSASWNASSDVDRESTGVDSTYVAAESPAISRQLSRRRGGRSEARHTAAATGIKGSEVIAHMFEPNGPRRPRCASVSPPTGHPV